MHKGYIMTENLTVSYQDTVILSDIHFTCSDSEFVAIVGKSGTGKSTFLKALADFIPYTGKIEMPESFGYVFQNYALFPWMTVETNIGFGLEGCSRSQRKKRVQEMLEKIEMTGYEKKYPAQLSGGQVQRVALARALAPDPEVMLMDEPYGALDHHTREKMQSWLLSIWKETQKTILFVTHYIEEAVFLADRIIVVSDKKFIADIPVPFSRPRSDQMRFSNDFLKTKFDVLEYMQETSR